jgi:aspartokinase-like uncharacterized kinase
VIVAGEGEFLARSIVPAGGEIISLRQQLGPEASTAACAVAMAALASDAKHAAPWVVKVGGSLFDWPDLTSRLTVWLATLPTRRIVLVPGGGAAADVVRAWDHDHELGDVAAHWLALRSLTLTAYFLAGRLPDGQVVNGWSECGAVWARGGVPVLDANAFVRADEGRPGALPHTWDATSDAIAARVAVRGAADRLVMLKSADPPNDNWRSGVSGYVDPICGRIAAEAAVRLEAVNLRSAAGVTALGGSPRASGGRQPSVEETTS